MHSVLDFETLACTLSKYIPHSGMFCVVLQQTQWRILDRERVPTNSETSRLQRRSICQRAQPAGSS